MKRCVVTFVALLVFFAISVSSKFAYIDKKLYEGSGCTTHDGRAGTCSFHCAALTDDEFRNLENTCGFAKKQVLVCCPTIDGTSTTAVPNARIGVEDSTLSPAAQPSTTLSTTTRSTTAETASQSPSTVSEPTVNVDEVATPLAKSYPILKEVCAYRTAKQVLRTNYIEEIKNTIEEENKWRIEFARENRKSLLKENEDFINNCEAEGKAIAGVKGRLYTRWCDTLQTIIYYTEPEPKLEVETFKNSHLAVLGWTQSDTVSWNCSGSLIHKNFVLSAAHCISNVGSPPDVVRIAVSDTFAIDYDIKQIVTHELYDSVAHYYDITLIRVEMQPRFRGKQPPLPACIWTEEAYPTESFTILGYNASASEEGFTLLRKVKDMALINVAECSISYAFSDELPDGMRDDQLCASELSESTDTCEGASGGPLQFNMVNGTDTPYLVGITSFGFQCTSEYPGVYTKIYNFLDWIERKLSEMMK